MTRFTVIRQKKSIEVLEVEAYSASDALGKAELNSREFRPIAGNTDWAYEVTPG